MSETMELEKKTKPWQWPGEWFRDQSFWRDVGSDALWPYRPLLRLLGSSTTWLHQVTRQLQKCLPGYGRCPYDDCHDHLEREEADETPAPSPAPQAASTFSRTAWISWPSDGLYHRLRHTDSDTFRHRPARACCSPAGLHSSSGSSRYRSKV
jgi:hypothetical protein